MTPRWLVNGLGLGALLALAALGLMFGAEIARYRHMVEALADMEECGANDREDACIDAAYARLMVAKGWK